MKRNLKALGLAVVAMLVIGAVGAVVAVQANPNEDGHIVSANGETTNHESSFVEGSDTDEENTLIFTDKDANEIHCNSNHFHGEIPGGTTKELTLDTTFGGAEVGSGCTAAGFPMTVFNNGCHLTFHHAETTPETTASIGEWSVTTDLHCPDGQPGIVVKTYSGGAHGFQVCEVVTPPQTGLEGVTIHNNYNTSKEPSTPHDLTLTIDLKGLHQAQSGLCGSGEGEGELHGEVTLEAFNEDEDQIDLFVEHTEAE